MLGSPSEGREGRYTASEGPGREEAEKDGEKLGKTLPGRTLLSVEGVTSYPAPNPPRVIIYTGVGNVVTLGFLAMDHGWLSNVSNVVRFVSRSSCRFPDPVFFLSSPTEKVGSIYCLLAVNWNGDCLCRQTSWVADSKDGLRDLGGHLTGSWRNLVLLFRCSDIQPFTALTLAIQLSQRVDGTYLRNTRESVFT